MDGKGLRFSNSRDNVPLIWPLETVAIKPSYFLPTAETPVPLLDIL